MIRGAYEIMDVIKEKTGIHHDMETSEDGLFTLQEVECLGACTNAPMMQVNNEWFYEDLTPENVSLLIDKMKEGTGFEPGPQIKERKNSEGPMGRTTLALDMEHVFHDRDFPAEKEKWETAKAAAAAAAAAAKKA
jgi:NADH dehydrogenase (ubiquinone) flavoprotein 2